MEIQVEIRKLHALIQKYLKKEIPLLMLTNQNKALFIILINQNEVLCIRMRISTDMLEVGRAKYTIYSFTGHVRNING